MDGFCYYEYMHISEIHKLLQFFEVIFVTAPHATDGHDALIVVDVDPQSSSYQQAIIRFKK